MPCWTNPDTTTDPTAAASVERINVYHVLSKAYHNPTDNAAIEIASSMLPVFPANFWISKHYQNGII